MLHAIQSDILFKAKFGNQISSWLIHGSKKNNSLEQDRFWLNGDSVALIVAGRQVQVVKNLIILLVINVQQRHRRLDHGLSFLPSSP